MLSPEGHSGEHPVKSFIFSGMGRPTFPVNIHTVKIHLAYWRAIEALLENAVLDKSVVLDEAVRPTTLVSLVKSLVLALSARPLKSYY